jgi:hypothetical protein
MASVAAVPSLIDDADFLAELDRMDTDAAPPRAAAGSAYWDQASLAEEGQGEVLVTQARTASAPDSPPRRARSAKPVRPVQLEKRAPPETPSRIDVPFRPEAPARPAQPAHRERPIAPEHVDEIGETRRTLATELMAPSVSATRYVSRRVAVATVVLCFSFGAGSAALVFQHRVSLIVALWSGSR